jgi:hypothetical protein
MGGTDPLGKAGFQFLGIFDEPRDAWLVMPAICEEALTLLRRPGD